jgi:hypothetical protein
MSRSQHGARQGGLLRLVGEIIPETADGLEEAEYVRPQKEFRIVTRLPGDPGEALQCVVRANGKALANQT